MWPLANRVIGGFSFNWWGRGAFGTVHMFVDPEYGIPIAGRKTAANRLFAIECGLDGGLVHSIPVSRAIELGARTVHVLQVVDLSKKNVEQDGQGPQAPTPAPPAKPAGAAPDPAGPPPPAPTGRSCRRSGNRQLTRFLKTTRPSRRKRVVLTQAPPPRVPDARRVLAFRSRPGPRGSGPLAAWPAGRRGTTQGAVS
jgi:hypothetical protein